MRRRITIAILGMVAAALLLVGLGTLALTRVSARTTARRELVSQADATSALLELGSGLRNPNGTRLPARQRLARVREALSLEDVSIVVLDAQNQADGTGDPFPSSVNLSPAQFASLRNGEVVSGSKGQQVYAVAPLGAIGASLPVLVLTRDLGPTVGSGWGWFLLSSGVVLLLGTLVALRLSRRLTQPLREATQATATIAHGDLSVRLPMSGGRPNDELDALAQSINEMADSLQRSRGLEQQFLLSVSHDLRTPLTSIQGYAEAIADGAAPDDRAAAAIILAESRRLGRLVRDLLDLAKLEARQFTFHPADIDLAALVTDSADGFRPDVAVAGLQLELVRPPGPVWGRADPDRVAQVVANLIENARKFAATTITVAVAAGPTGPEISVSDDGPGISAADLPHVFERLYVAGHEPVRAEVGSGLGLAIVRELVEAMGGRVWAEAAEPGGARLMVHLPPPPPAPATGPAPPSSNLRSAPPSPPTSTPTGPPTAPA